MSIDFINEPFIGVKALDVLAWRDLEVVEGRANTYVYATTELLLAVLCVAEVVELVARVCFAIVTAPYFLATGKPGFQLQRVLKHTGETFAITVIGLYYNLFSQLASFNSIALLFGLDKREIEEITDIKNNKEFITNRLTNMSKMYVFKEGFEFNGDQILRPVK